jgi:hypothetical protein
MRGVVIGFEMGDCLPSYWLKRTDFWVLPLAFASFVCLATMSRFIIGGRLSNSPVPATVSNYIEYDV